MPGVKEDSDRLAGAVGLDMTAWWRPTADHFLSRLSEAQILAVVSEGISADAAQRLAVLKKEAMATEAQQLLAATTWLPSALRPATARPKEAVE